MKDEISVLIADDNNEFGDYLADHLNNEGDMGIVGVARDGVQAIDLIKEKRPDVVVLDIIMPNLDGIAVLERIIKVHLSKRPLFIMLSAIGHDVFIQKAITLGAEYYIVKPFDINVLVTRIRQMYHEKRNVYNQNDFISAKYESKYSRNYSGKIDIETEVTHLMRDVGIPPHMAGYQYLREAIIQTINDPKSFNSVTKILYPSVADKFNTTAQKVERSIRNAIESAWNRGNHDSMDTLFGYSVSFGKGKPTNSEFIAMMADKVKVMMGSIS
ncbi:MAG: sporulation transcription factor Spo0A [Clostridiales bacterium]